jgi:spore coat protein CotH
MNKIKLLLLLVVIATSCNPNEEAITTSEELNIHNFSFLKTHNSSLNSDIHLSINGNSITGNIPVNSNHKELIASFDYEGSFLKVNGQDQISGISKIDFTNIIDYKLESKNGNQLIYKVDLTKFTGLPIVHINTYLSEKIDNKDDYKTGTITIDGGRLSPDFTETEIQIRGRGNSTWYFHDKKPYQLKLPEKLEFLGMPKDKKWIFLAEHSDKTLMRNKIAFEMGYLSTLDWTPESIYSEVFINNEYNGTYHISQKVEESTRRVNLGDTGYLLEIDQLDRLDSDDVYFYSQNFLINIKEPEIPVGSSEFSYIKNLINAFENNLHSNLFDHATYGYSKYIDVDSFIDWYLINEITKNQDARNYSSIFLNVIPGGKIKMGPIWDFDLAFGNVNYSDCEHPEGFWVKDNAWYARLFNDPIFVNKVKDRFAYYTNKENSILDKMDEYAELLKYAQYENNIKWQVIGNYQWPNAVVFDTYEEEVEYLKSWFTTRMDWLDNAFSNL